MTSVYEHYMRDVEMYVDFYGNEYKIVNHFPGMRSTEVAVVVDSSHNIDGQVMEDQISSADKITYESGSASLKYVFDCWPPHGIVSLVHINPFPLAVTIFANFF